MTDLMTLGEEFRDVMAAVCTPVAVVTAMDGARPHGTTVSAFASLSVDPPMVLVSLDRGSTLLEVVRRQRRFGVNVLGSDHAHLAQNFARKGMDKFDAVAWSEQAGSPRLDGVPAWLACDLTDMVVGGDHIVVLGRVLDAQSAPGAPLTYHRREFGTHAGLVA